MSSIILFGGTFDPIHNGHLHIASMVKSRLNADKVIFVPAKNPRWKDPSATSSRLEMLELAIKDYKDFEISKFEINSSEKVNYSIDLAKYFCNIYPVDKIYFLIGYDQLEKLHLWYKIDELKDLVKIVAVNRNGYSKAEENIKKYDVELLDIEEKDISSTDIRSLQSLDTPLCVIKYIINHDLYFTGTVKNMMNEKRYKHSCSTGFLAYDIALNNGFNPWIAFRAGYLHDIAKDLNKDLEKNMMLRFYKEYCDYPEVCYHQFLGEYLVKNLFLITDKDTLEAIKYHTTGKKEMTTLGKIIYAADKIEPTRGYDSSTMIDMMEKDVDEGFIEVLKENRKYYNEKNFFVNTPLQLECFKYYLK